MVVVQYDRASAKAGSRFRLCSHTNWSGALRFSRVASCPVSCPLPPNSIGDLLIQRLCHRRQNIATITATTRAAAVPAHASLTQPRYRNCLTEFDVAVKALSFSVKQDADCEAFMACPQR
jgi:hypothetical protein